MMTQPEKVDFIMDKTCAFFGVSREEIKIQGDKGASRFISRRFAIKTLRDNTMLTFKSIADLLGYKKQETALYHYNTFTDEISDNVFGSEKTKRIYKEYTDYLNL